MAASNRVLPERHAFDCSDISSRLETYGYEAGKQHQHSSGLANSYLFKLKLKSRDGSERNHRLTCGTGSMKELMSAIIQKVGDDIDSSRPLRILYVDDEEDKVLLATDNDLTAAVNFARTSGSKVRVHVDLHYLMLVSVKSFKICSTQQICLMLLSLLR
jgi:hypothetical protein